MVILFLSQSQSSTTVFHEDTDSPTGKGTPSLCLLKVLKQEAYGRAWTSNINTTEDVKWTFQFYQKSIF